MSEERTTYDIAIVGGGIVGVATAMALGGTPGTRVIVLEAEDRLAAHQSGHNSGVVHSGLYYRPGSLKARLCAEGRVALRAFCDEHGVRHQRCGKLVVATDPSELPRLDELERRGRANGLAGLARLGPEGIREHEPHAAGIAGLWVPETGIVDFPAAVDAMASRVRAAGHAIALSTRLTACRRDGTALALETTRGVLRARQLVACAGLQADRVARLCGVEPGLRIVPFRGEYHVLAEARRSLVRGLIYPVPDPRFPFLGVHLTRMVDGTVEAGPNAVLALRREGYTRGAFSTRDALDTLGYPGFWRMAARFGATGLAESWRSMNPRVFAASVRRLVPELADTDLIPGGAGVRAQALAPDGRLLDDFAIVEAERMIHVLNAPSPAATASIAIGRHLAARARERFGAGPA